MSLTSQYQVGAKTIQPVAGGIEGLQQILATQQDREVAYSEAQEVGRSLIEFYETLAAEDSNEAI